MYVPFETLKVGDKFRLYRTNQEAMKVGAFTEMGEYLGAPGIGQVFKRTPCNAVLLEPYTTDCVTTDKDGTRKVVLPAGAMLCMEAGDAVIVEEA